VRRRCARRNVFSIPNVLICTFTVPFFGLHLAPNQVEGMDVSWDIPEKGEGDVDQKVARAAGQEEGRAGGEEDSDEDEDDIRTFDHFEMLSEL